MEPVPRKRRPRLRYVAAGFVLLCVGAAALLYYLDDDPVTRMPPKSSIPADLPPDIRKKIEDLYSSDVQCRSSAAGYLDGNTGAIPFLVPLLGDVEGLISPPEPQLSWDYAKESVGNLLWPPEPDLRQHHVGWNAARSLASCGKEAMAPLVAVLRGSRNQYARANAARALVWLNATQAFAALVPALADPSHHVRLQTVIGFSGEDQPVERRGRVLWHPTAMAPSDPALCRAAMPSLIALLGNDRSSHIRWLAATALGRMKENPDVVDPIVAALNDKEQDVAGTAAIALGDLENRRAVPGLIAALGDSRPKVGAMASEALQKLTGQDFGDDPAPWQAWWEQNKGAEPGVDTTSPP